MNRTEEAAVKISLIRELLGSNQAALLRGIDWFAWATAGGSSAVLLAAETGIAEVLISPAGAWIITDNIEALRLCEEELPAGFSLQATPWAYPAERQAFFREVSEGMGILSDRPQPGEQPLPPELLAAKRIMTVPEAERYQQVGLLAAEAMTEPMMTAKAEWTEFELAGAGAKALLERGLQPALILAAGERRLPLYRHPVPSHQPLEKIAMLVFCARGYGLYANLTRFVSFGSRNPATAKLHQQAREIESEALKQSRPGTRLATVYATLAQAYEIQQHSEAIHEHHQGGTTGYLSREIVAMPGSVETLQENTPVAWNPSLRGAKVEDTFLVKENGLLNLTSDPAWPTIRVGEIERPLVLEK
jgi:hypothetical protein